MKSKINEVWEKYSKLFQINGEIISGELFLNKHEFERAVEELLSEKNAEIERLKNEIYKFELTLTNLLGAK